MDSIIKTAKEQGPNAAGVTMLDQLLEKSINGPRKQMHKNKRAVQMIELVRQKLV